MKLVKILGISAFILYISACAVLYSIQDSLIFDPRVLPADYVFRVGEEVRLSTPDGVELSCLWIKEKPAQGVILYLHGTRGSNRRCLRQASGFQGNGYDIFMPDYRGYGKSGGKISSETQMFQDMQLAYDFLKQHYAESQIVVIGYSLGTGFASYLAAQNQPSQLVLIAPFVSFIDLKNQWLPIAPDFLVKYPMRNDQFLEQVNCPVSLYHGTEDDIIPFQSSERLLAQFSQKVTLTPLRGSGHRGSIFSNTMRNSVANLLK